LGISALLRQRIFPGFARIQKMYILVKYAGTKIYPVKGNFALFRLFWKAVPGRITPVITPTHSGIAKIRRYM